jgi:hypothetical protein
MKKKERMKNGEKKIRDEEKKKSKKHRDNEITKKI